MGNAEARTTGICIIQFHEWFHGNRSKQDEDEEGRVFVRERSPPPNYASAVAVKLVPGIKPAEPFLTVHGSSTQTRRHFPLLLSLPYQLLSWPQSL
jgi:hypothetical protein